MKKSIFLFFSLIIFLASCSKEESSSVDIDTTNVDTLAFLEDTEERRAVLELTDELIDDAINLSFTAPSLSARGASSSASQNSHDSFKSRHGRCATVTDTTANGVKTRTIDWGTTGCRNRTGKIIITSSVSTSTVGSYKQVVYSNFTSYGIKIEGTSRREVTAVDSNGNRTTRRTLTGGKYTYSDNSVETAESSKVKFKYRTGDRSTHYTTVTGSESSKYTASSGTVTNYSRTINSALKYLKSCERYTRHYPVEGKVTIVDGTTTKVIDYGNGTCDNTYVVTTNGVSQTITIKKRSWWY